jgi:hypothetical protein
LASAAVSFLEDGSGKLLSFGRGVSRYRGALKMQRVVQRVAFCLLSVLVFLLAVACPGSHAQSVMKADPAFPYYWELTLSPPIRVEYGLGVNGVLWGAARPEGQLCRYGDILEGDMKYVYSDCGMVGGGMLDGSIHGSTVDMTWQKDYRLHGTCTGGFMSGSVEKDGKAYGTFELKSKSEPPRRRARQPRELLPWEYTARAAACKIPWNDRLGSPLRFTAPVGGTAYCTYLLRVCDEQEKSGRLSKQTMEALDLLARVVENARSDSSELSKIYAQAGAALYRESVERYLEIGDGESFLEAAFNWITALRKAGQNASASEALAWVDAAVYRTGFSYGSTPTEFWDYFNSPDQKGRRSPKNFPKLRAYPYKYKIGQLVEVNNARTSEASMKRATVLYRLNGLYYLKGPYGTHWAFETQIDRVASPPPPAYNPLPPVIHRHMPTGAIEYR